MLTNCIVSTHITERRGRSPARPVGGKMRRELHTSKDAGPREKSKPSQSRNRSNSPFGLFHHSSRNNAFEEKKELDDTASTFSGRQSPTIDPLAAGHRTSQRQQRYHSPKPPVDRPSSRASSPCFSRPGLQEDDGDDDDDDMGSRYGGRSPARRSPARSPIPRSRTPTFLLPQKNI
jgi:hypothetical protein